MKNNDVNKLGLIYEEINKNPSMINKSNTQEPANFNSGKSDLIYVGPSGDINSIEVMQQIIDFAKGRSIVIRKATEADMGSGERETSDEISPFASTGLFPDDAKWSYVVTLV